MAKRTGSLEDDTKKLKESYKVFENTKGQCLFPNEMLEGEIRIRL